MTTRHLQKNLTVMFTDISGFTKHTEMISREDLMKRLESHNELLLPIIAHFDGKIVKTIGDAFLITFESPTNAVQCGLFMQHTLVRYNAGKKADDQIHIKVSINSGEVTVTDTDVFGDPVNVAAKIEKATNPDEIYFTEAVFLAMNKAEVPTSFVKAFRPKGADSQEIKLYKVAMDEADERYQKIISHTKIDPEKVKTRVLELSTVAEKEFTRYQDTLTALVDKQTRSSRNMVVVVLAAVILLGAGIIFAVSQLAGGVSPEQQLTQDVRAYLTNKRPAEARQVVDAYLRDHGADKITEELQAEIRTFELGEFAATVTALMVRGEPENAKAEITKFFGASKPEGEPARMLSQVEAWLGARGLLNSGKVDEVLSTLNAAFGETAPAAEIALLRERAIALKGARAMMGTQDRHKEPAKIIATLDKAFGADTSNESVLEILEDALGHELFRVAAEHGLERAREDQEALRKRFRSVLSWTRINIMMLMGHIWHVGIVERNHSMKITEQYYWVHFRQIEQYVKDKPDMLYRWGMQRFMIERYLNQGTAVAFMSWRKAIELDPQIASRHSEFWKIYELPMGEEAMAASASLTAALRYALGAFTAGVDDVRELIKKTCYAELKPLLVEYANSRDIDGEDKLETERLTAFMVLAEMGDVALIEDKFWLLRKILEQYPTSSSGSTPAAEHIITLFQGPMTSESYREFRVLLDAEYELARERKGRFQTYSRASEDMRLLVDGLKAAQAGHTAAYSE